MVPGVAFGRLAGRSGMEPSPTNRTAAPPIGSGPVGVRLTPAEPWLRANRPRVRFFKAAQGGSVIPEHADQREQERRIGFDAI